MDDVPLPSRSRTWRAAWWSVAVPLAVLGIAAASVLLGPLVVLVLLASGSGGSAIVRHQLRQSVGEARPGLWPPVPTLLAGCTTAAVIGLIAELGVVGIGLIAIMAGTWTLLRHLARRARDDPGGPAGDGQVAGHTPAELIPADPLPDLPAVPALSTPELCWTWRLSYVRLLRPDCAGYQLDHLAQLRAACLEELEQRDPVAFRRWLPTARAAGDPARAFCRRQATGGTQA